MVINNKFELQDVTEKEQLDRFPPIEIMLQVKEVASR